MQNPDVVIVGAGHNGLAAGALLARRGQRVLILEKNRYVGGMAGTREILDGLSQRRRCVADVSARRRGSPRSSSSIASASEFLELPIMSCSLWPTRAIRSLVFYANPLKHGVDSVLADSSARSAPSWASRRLVAFTRYPAKVIARYARRATTPKDHRQSCSPRRRRTRRHASSWSSPSRGSAIDLIDRFFPDKERHPHAARPALVRRGAIDLQGPVHAGQRVLPRLHALAERRWRPDEAGEAAGWDRCPKRCVRSIEAKGGEVRLATPR